MLKKELEQLFEKNDSVVVEFFKKPAFVISKAGDETVHKMTFTQFSRMSKTDLNRKLNRIKSIKITSGKNQKTFAYIKKVTK